MTGWVLFRITTGPDLYPLYENVTNTEVFITWKCDRTWFVTSRLFY